MGASETLEDEGVTYDNFDKCVSYHNKITLEDKKTAIRRGDKIWYLTQITSELLGDKTVQDMNDIPDECFDVAEVLAICGFRVHDADEPVYYLRVQHYYTEKQALALFTLHADFKTRLKKYQLWEDERICSDHVDFIPVSVCTWHTEILPTEAR